MTESIWHVPSADLSISFSVKALALALALALVKYVELYH